MRLISASELVAILCGLGGAVCWGDPEHFASRQLGFGARLRFFAGLALVAVGAGLWLLPAAGARDANAGTGEPVDWPLIRMADGKPTTLADLRGKAVLVNLWANWCGPCLSEMPSLIALKERLKDRQDDLAFAFVAVGSKPEDIAALVAKEGWDLPVYFPNAAQPGEFQTEGIPATFLLDRNGRVVRRVVGSENWNTAAREKELRQLADAPATAAQKQESKR